MRTNPAPRTPSPMPNPSATLSFEGRSLDMEVVAGTEGERAIDIADLRSKMGLVTLDPSYSNTGSTTSKITFIDGELGVLRYRGYPLEQLAEKSSFIEASFLLIFGRLPNAKDLEATHHQLSQHVFIHEDIRDVISAYPSNAHPMAVLSATTAALSAFYPDAMDVNNRANLDLTIARLMAKLPTIASFIFRKMEGRPYVYPKRKLGYVENLLHMMFSTPTEPYEPDPEEIKALDLMLLLHADHEQNCSTSTVRLVGSAETNLFASIAAGMCALWGPLHGGANEAVVNMLQRIHESGGDVADYVKKVKDKSTGLRLMGFGHRVYKNLDPRASIIKSQTDRLLANLNRTDPLLDIAKRLEETALSDSYFIDRKLYPNVDFYSGVIYRAMKIPVKMFTVMFALGRLPGWIAHWKEMLDSPGRRIGRPRQIYTGETARDYVDVSQRP
jgi:citrate synthase